MSPETIRKQKNRQRQNRLNRAIEEILGRLREGLDNLTDGLRPARPQAIPVPMPVRRPRRR